jgi:hypothetical protein
MATADLDGIIRPVIISLESEKLTLTIFSLTL